MLKSLYWKLIPLLITLTFFETFLDSSYSNDDPRLQLSGYCLVRADHPMGTKRAGVCIYYKECMSILRIFWEIKNGWENTILNINNSNPYLTLLIGDFNARNTFWCGSHGN